MDRLYSLSHAPIPFHFRQSARDFVVDEIPLYDFSGSGEHLVVHARKKNMTTWELVEAMASHLGIKAKEIGYAGLKDKHAQTKQYLSVHRSHEEKLKAFSHENVKILSTTYHDNKIRMGHLRGNRFFIRLKKVTPVAAKMIKEALREIAANGMPNFFGYQRFGLDGENYLKGEAIALGQRKERNVKLRRLYLNAYQSHRFNLWLSRRLEISRLLGGFAASELTDLLNMPESTISALQAQAHPFKMIRGDLLMHYPHGRVFEFEGAEAELERFAEKDLSVTGLLCGKRVSRASGLAGEIEKEFDAELAVDGARRYAWVFPEAIESEYRESEAWFELHFTLPKGSYATVLIEEIAKREISPKEGEE